MAAAKDKSTVSLRADVAEKYNLKTSITQAVNHISGIVGEIDFTKLTLEEIEAYPKLNEFLEKK